MIYQYKASDRFWTNFYRLSPSQKQSARIAWQIFKKNPFDPHLGAHKIHRLSGIFNTTVYAVEVEADLRVIFRIEGDLVYSMNIGPHDVYTQ
jgi:hypothetical protein